MKSSKLLLLLTAFVFLFTGVQQAGAKDRIAAGIILGEPSGISLKFGKFPVLAFGFSGVYGHLHVNLDYWIINKPIEAPFFWYLGVGAKLWLGSYNIHKAADNFALGARVPIGLQWFITNEWELFLEAAPGVMIFSYSGAGFWWDAGIGIRYHF